MATIPVTPSITSWTRLEPRSREADMRTTLSARVFDPLWLLARQWQVGEFQGEDAGTPVLARARAKTALLSRCHLGELLPNTREQAAPYDPQRLPLEAMVEQQPVRPTAVSDVRMLTLSVEAGLHFLRMLETQPLTKSYRAALIMRFALRPIDAVPPDDTDEAAARFVQTMVGRAPDARRMEQAFRGGGAAQVVLEPALRIVAADRAEVVQTADSWLAWYDSLFSEPAAETSAWIPSRMEYAMSVAARMSEQLPWFPLVPRVLLTGYADKENAIKAINEVGLYQYIEKPWNNDDLRLIIRNALEKTVLLRQLKEKIQESRKSPQGTERRSKGNLASLCLILGALYRFHTTRVPSQSGISSVLKNFI